MRKKIPKPEKNSLGDQLWTKAEDGNLWKINGGREGELSGKAAMRSSTARAESTSLFFWMRI